MGGAGLGICILLGKLLDVSASLFIVNQLLNGDFSSPGFKIWFSLLTQASIILFRTSKPNGKEGKSACGN